MSKQLVYVYLSKGGRGVRIPEFSNKKGKAVKAVPSLVG